MNDIGIGGDGLNAVALAELARLKQGARATWAAGDYQAVAERQVWEVGARLVQRIAIGQGEAVLDVGCGTGNAALRAAQAGGNVVGVDLTPELLETGRRLAAAAGVEIEWRRGDAEDLPCPDAAFDVVLSTFGCMFAPRHAVAAGELARVLRPGGRLALTTWTPEGAMGELFATVSAYLPFPSALAEPPILWGSETHVVELFDGTDIDIEFERDLVSPARLGTPEATVDFLASTFGPLIMARQLTEASRDWPQLRRNLAALYERNEPFEYLIVIGHKEES